MCDGPHLIRDCPKKKTFYAMVLQEEEDEAQISSMRFLNSISKDEIKSSKKEENKGGSLMFVEVKVNARNTKALVDSGATHSFIAEEEARKLGIHYTKELGRLKVVNSPSNPILGVSRGIPMKIVEWKGTIDLIVVPMDDYRMVLGMDFLDMVCPSSFERDNTLRITKGSTIHIIPLERRKTKARSLSTMKMCYDQSNIIKKNMKPKREVRISEACLKEQGSISHMKSYSRFYEAERRNRIQSTSRNKSMPYSKRFFGENEKTRSSPVTTSRHMYRRLDEDVKGLSGGGCHGPSFWKIPRSSRELRNDQVYSRSLRRDQECSTRPWKMLEYCRCPWNKGERSGIIKRTLDEARTTRKTLE